MDTRINKYNESDKMSRVSKNSDLYKEISSNELDHFNVHSNATVIGNQKNEIDVEQIKKILDKRYNERPQRKSIRIEPSEEVSRLEKEDTKEYDLTKVLEKAKDEKEESYEENRAKKLRNTQFDILKNLDIDDAKEEKKVDAEENLMNLINTITINEAKKKEEKDIDPLEILTDLKGEDNTSVYENMETSVTSITEIKDKEEVDNSFYTSDVFKKKDFEDENDFVDDEKVSVGVKILIGVLVIAIGIGIFLFIKSFL